MKILESDGSRDKESVVAVSHTLWIKHAVTERCWQVLSIMANSLTIILFLPWPAISDSLLWS